MCSVTSLIPPGSKPLGLSKAAPGHLGSEDTALTVWSSSECRDSDHGVGVQACGGRERRRRGL